MYQYLQNNDLVITNNKNQILKYLQSQKILLNLRLMTVKEFKNSFFGTYNEKAIYYLMDKYHYKYDIAKLYLDNFLFLESLKSELEEQNLIIYSPLFKESIKRIVVMTPYIDNYLFTEIKKYPYLLIPEKQGIFHPEVKAYNNIYEEVVGVTEDILKLLETVDIKKIFLVIADNTYEPYVRTIFNLFNLPINIDNQKNIYSLSKVQEFLKILNETKSFLEALKPLEEGPVYNKIIDICNKYIFKDLDETIILAITEELKSACIEKEKLSMAINLADISEIDNENYYFILGFNQGKIPHIYKDEDYFSDSKKSKLGILTSFEKNKIAKQEVINKITNNPHIFLSYKKNLDNQETLKSLLIEELDLPEIPSQKPSYSYSNLFNRICLAKKLDSFIKFNEKDYDLSLLYYNYSDINYLTYDNNYKTIKKSNFQKYFPNIVLSYAALDNFYRCSFKYYLIHILKLNKFEETFMTIIGNIYHTILAKCFNSNFDFEQEYNLLIQNKYFNAKEKFFLNKLKEELKEVINIINHQNTYSSLTNSLYEQKIELSLNNEVNFLGIIDKVVYLEENQHTYLAIIDYKTGNTSLNLNYLLYGIDMQLPIYLLLSDYLKFNNPIVVGFYLQKVIGTRLNYQIGKSYQAEKEKMYRLNGYSLDNEDILAKLDYNYQDSKVIKGMKKSSKGFYNYAKILTTDNFLNIKQLVTTKILEAHEKIKEADFAINPKNIGGNLVGCEFCSFKDICYKNEENEVNLEEINYHEFLGGEPKNVD